MTETTRESFWIRVCGDMTESDRRNLNRATWVLFAWFLSFAGVVLLNDRDLLPAGAVSWILAAIPSLIGVVALFAYGRFFREADELQRKIQLQALALGFGAAFFGSFGYSVFERLGAPPGNVTTPATIMVLFYLIGLWWGRRHYR